MKPNYSMATVEERVEHEMILAYNHVATLDNGTDKDQIVGFYTRVGLDMYSGHYSAIAITDEQAGAML
jgi:hypothetical protein